MIYLTKIVESLQDMGITFSKAEKEKLVAGKNLDRNITFPLDSLLVLMKAIIILKAENKEMKNMLEGEW